MKKFSKRLFFTSSIAIGFLLIPCFFASFAEEEGTLRINLLWTILTKLFYVLRFPTHTLFWNFFSSNAILFTLGLGINCMFYGLLIERMFSIYKKIKQKD